MDDSPQAVSGTTFRIVKKGYDPDEVRAYLTEVSGALAKAQEHAAAMEGRARAAVAKAQELMHQRQNTPDRGTKVEDTETISRTLLLAQRTADTTVADARKEADKTIATARADAESTVNAANAEAARLVETAKGDARRAGESERIAVEEEVQQLLARLEFLRDDVTQLERFTGEHRARLREAADALTDIAERPVGGLGEHRPPVLSAASDMPPPSGDPSPTPAAGSNGVAEDEVDGWDDDDALTFDDDVEEIDDAEAGDDDLDVDRDEPTQALRIVPAEPEVDDRDNLELFSDHEITAEVPITPAPAPGGMRIVGDDEAR